jgi:uncharacterized protein (TIGR02646 family)
MIRVNRDIEKPEVLKSQQAIKGDLKLKKHFKTDRTERGQIRFEFNESLWLATLPDLHKVFSGKCAYCEQPVSLDESWVDHFRPIVDAVGLDGKVMEDGYWWLAYEWDNLYLACRNCVTSKANRFPVVDGEHAPTEALGDKLLKEPSLLIDPCHDDPAMYLSVDRQGVIYAIEPAVPKSTQYKELNRGQITIDIFGLNRDELVAARRERSHPLGGAERGGSTTQLGRSYAATIAARYLGMMLNPRFTDPVEQITEVRLEPGGGNDFAVVYKDSHRVYHNVKVSLPPLRTKLWEKIWREIDIQVQESSFLQGDRLVLQVGTPNDTLIDIQEMTESASGSTTPTEWLGRLSSNMRSILERVRPLMEYSGQDDYKLWSLFSVIDVVILLPKEAKELAFIYMPSSNISARDLFSQLVDLVFRQSAGFFVVSRDSLIKELKRLAIEITDIHQQEEKVEVPLPKKRTQKQKSTKPLHYGTSTATITKIEINNFKAISQLTINFNRPSVTHESQTAQTQTASSTPDITPWKVLLGENSTGKSTILQAVAVALVGKPIVEQYRLRPEKILHRTTEGRAEKGYIKIWLSDQPKTKPVQVRFSEAGLKYINRRLVRDLYVRGFGATRLLPKNEDRQPPTDVPPQMDVENLFDPFDPLFDAEKWLPGLEPSRFDAVALAYKDILGLEDLAVKDNTGQSSQKVFEQSSEQILISDPFGVKVGLDELSDGYQSVLALATDIIAGVPEKLTDFRNASGIILIDEIGANLHPRWRMRFVKDLRRTFPRMQFLVTTHEPLCLRGLEEGEVAVMQRQEKEVFILDKDHGIDLPSPNRMRVGQLLTSRYFGLYSTVDPEIEDDYQKYCDLLIQRTNKTNGKWTDEKATQLEELRTKLNNKSPMILGDTRRDQMVYELIDEYLALEKAEGQQDKRIQDLNEATKKRVLDIWKRARLFSGPNVEGQRTDEL